MKSRRLVLASGSPRRKELLKNAGVSLIVHRPDIDETAFPGESPVQLVKRLASSKAQSVGDLLKLGPPQLILAADTIVVHPNGKRILGKPTSRGDAIRMIKTLQGKSHWVYTGYSIYTTQAKVRSVTRAIKTTVKFRNLNDAQVKKYVELGESMDKAGAYSAQGKGMGIIQSIRGSYTNVVGLPIAEVLEDLRVHFKWGEFV